MVISESCLWWLHLYWGGLRLRKSVKKGDHKKKKFLKTFLLKPLFCLMWGTSGSIETASTFGVVVWELSRGKRWGYLQKKGLWSRYLLVDCYGWVEILGGASVEVCWGWAHWESRGRCVDSCYGRNMMARDRHKKVSQDSTKKKKDLTQISIILMALTEI